MVDKWVSAVAELPRPLTSKALISKFHLHNEGLLEVEQVGFRETLPPQYGSGLKGAGFGVRVSAGALGML